jgi:DNA/RNA-binding domain of Phe-tRNA-synthetase-like protein
VSPSTERALIVAEGLHATAAADVPALIEALAGHARALWRAPRAQAILTAAAPRLEFSLDGLR